MFKKKQARSWRKMLRARDAMNPLGYELEIDEFTRNELQLQGKKRSTNVWMDHVHEQDRIETTNAKKRSKTAEDDWNNAMTMTLDDDDNNLDSFSSLANLPGLPVELVASPSITSKSSKSKSQSIPFTTSSSIVQQKDVGWPPLNLNSPWPRVAAHSVKGKGSFRLIDETSYSFTNWTRETESLPPVSIECRNTLIERRRTADGHRMRPPSASEEKACKERNRKVQHSKKKLANVMWIDPKDRNQFNDRKRREALADAETMEDGVMVTLPGTEKNGNDLKDLEELDDDEAGEHLMDGWVKFMEEHKKQRRTRYLEDGPDPLPPSALIRGRMVVNKEMIPGEPSQRKKLRLEQDIMKTCTDPSKILPIPTLNRRQYKVVLDYMGEQLTIRSNLSRMETAEREQRKYLLAERRYLISKRGAQDEAKARQALLKFLKRAMVLCFHEWKDYVNKMNKARTFVRKILMAKQSWVFNTIKFVRDTLQRIKRRGITFLQSNVRRFVCKIKYDRLIVKVRAKRCIKRAWRAYCARNMLSRMIAKREAEEKRVHQQLRRILLRNVVKMLFAWREYTKMMRFAAMMGSGSTRKNKKRLFDRWKQKITWLLHKRPISATRIQQFVRRRFNIHRWSRIMSMHRACKPIQKMVRARIASTMLVRMKQKKENLMKKVRKRMRADTDRILQLCLNLLSKHASLQISHRSKLGGFVALKTKRLLAKWRKVAVHQIQERLRSAIIIQSGYRGLLGRRLAEMLKVSKQRQQDASNKERQMGELDELMRDRGPKLDPITGLPIIGRKTKRLVALLAEKIEVAVVMAAAKKIRDKAKSKFASQASKDAAKKLEKVEFDSRVLSFSQRFRLRTDTSFLVKFLDDEIKKETWSIWKIDRTAEIAAAKKIRDTIEADAKRAEEMMAMLEAANQSRPEGKQKVDKEEPAYPTAGIFLNFQKASEKEMEEALESWMELSLGGYLPRQVLLGWVARGIMDQNKASMRVSAWRCVKKVMPEDLLWDINMLISTIKKEGKEDQENGLRKKKKNKDGTPNLDNMGELARRRRWRHR